jgi:AcrR family transcriptional regulator
MKGQRQTDTMSKHASAGSIWLRPQPERSDRLSRDKISAAALSIADCEGFAAVSMRRIADRLGASTMSLYYYVRTKADLVALMDDALMGEILLPEGQLPRGWRAAIAAIARRTRDVFVRHAWALLSMQGAGPGPNAMRHFEQSLEALEEAPLSVAGKLALIQLVDDFVFGHALRTSQATTSFGEDSARTRSAEALAQQLFKTGALARTAALFDPTDSREAARHRQWLMEDRFELALAAVLDGATRQFSQARRSRPRRGSRRDR